MASTARPQRVLALALAASVTGCSWLTVTKPKPGETARAHECTDHYMAPIADTAIAAGFAFVAVAGVAILVSVPDAPDADDEDAAHAAADFAMAINGIAGRAVLMFGLFGAISGGTSAAHGYSNVAACRSLPEAAEGPGFDRPWGAPDREAEDPDPEVPPDSWLPRD